MPAFWFMWFSGIWKRTKAMKAMQHKYCRFHGWKGLLLFWVIQLFLLICCSYCSLLYFIPLKQRSKFPDGLLSLISLFFAARYIFSSFLNTGNDTHHTKRQEHQTFYFTGRYFYNQCTAGRNNRRKNIFAGRYGWRAPCQYQFIWQPFQFSFNGRGIVVARCFYHDGYHQWILR